MKQLATALTAGTFTAIFVASVNAIAGWIFDPLTGGMLVAAGVILGSGVAE